MYLLYAWFWKTRLRVQLVLFVVHGIVRFTFMSAVLWDGNSHRLFFSGPLVYTVFSQWWFSRWGKKSQVEFLKRRFLICKCMYIWTDKISSKIQVKEGVKKKIWCIWIQCGFHFETEQLIQFPFHQTFLSASIHTIGPCKETQCCRHAKKCSILHHSGPFCPQ